MQYISTMITQVLANETVSGVVSEGLEYLPAMDSFFISLFVAERVGGICGR